MSHKGKLKIIVISIAMMGHISAAYAETDGQPIQELPAVEIKDKRLTKDEVGKNQQFSKEIVSIYKGKSDVETYKGNSVSDLLSGIPGVYSGDARNSGALDPNIRGQQGQGRIPVSVDGTEQSITISRGYAGANNRNYVDPNLISSVYVEKGPSLDRNIRSGIAGSVALKTIDIDDIVPKDQKFGMELKLEGGNNSIKPRGSMYDPYIGKDYRNLPDPLVAGGGMWRAMLDDSDRVAQRFDGRNDMFKDKAARIALGTRQEHFDLMFAYAYRDKGNYFSGKKGAEDYGYIGVLDAENLKRLQNTSANGRYNPKSAPIGLFYFPGGEVTNTSLNTRSLLGKATFRLPAEQSIKLGWRRTDTRFGEVMPSRIFGPITANDKDTLNRVPEWSPARVKQQAYNIDYAWKPKGSRWIDLQASLWTTRTDSATNSAGGVPGDAMWTDIEFDRKWLRYREMLAAWDKLSQAERDQLTQWGLNPKKPTQADWVTENIDGRHNAIAGEKYYAKNNRIGFNISNKMQLHDRVELTLMGDFQHEKLRARNNFSDFFANWERRLAWNDPNSGVYRNWELDNIGLPRNGTRQEYNFGFNFKFEPTDRLTITAGARYTDYHLKDDYIDQFAASKNGLDKQTGIGYTYRRAATPEEYRLYNEYERIVNENYAKAQAGLISFADVREVGVGGLTEEMVAAYKLPKAGWSWSWHSSTKEGQPRVLETNGVVWNKDESGRYHLADNPFFNGSIDVTEKVRNPKYDPNNPNDPEQPEFIPKYTRIEQSQMIRPLTAEEVQQARKQKDHGWAPMLSLTYRLTDYARVYARYVESLRYPSIFEGTQGFSASSRLGFKWKPEHAKNWEIGYIHDLTGIFPKMRFADVRLNYFHNKTRNIMDRDENMRIEQFDKHIRTSLELQARFDTGKWFGSLGVVRNLKNQMCDEGFAYSQKWVAFKLERLAAGEEYTPPPTCANGGLNPNGYLAQMIQPRWSADAELGGRFFYQKLETGVRMHYHSRIYADDSSYKVPTAWNWKQEIIWDAYARYRFNDHISAEIVGTNLTDRYYLDPFSRSYMPAPGRTIKVGLTAKF